MPGLLGIPLGDLQYLHPLFGKPLLPERTLQDQNIAGEFHREHLDDTVLRLKHRMVQQFKMGEYGKEVRMVQKRVAVAVAGDGLEPDEPGFGHHSLFNA
jgi:hypothetical protein